MERLLLSAPKLTTGCSCCGRMFNPQHERGRQWTIGQFEFDVEDLSRLCGACLGSCIMAYWPKGRIQIGDIPNPVSQAELTLWVVRRMQTLQNRSERGEVVHTCGVIRSNHWEQCSNMAVKVIDGQHYCSRHAALIAKGKVPKLAEEAPKLRCFVVANSLDDAIRQVKKSWESSHHSTRANKG